MDPNFRSLITDVMKIVGTAAVAKGIGDAAAWELITGGVIALAGVGWSQLWHIANK